MDTFCNVLDNSVTQKERGPFYKISKAMLETFFVDTKVNFFCNKKEAHFKKSPRQCLKICSSTVFMEVGAVFRTFL